MQFTKIITRIFCILIAVWSISVVCAGQTLYVISDLRYGEIRRYAIEANSLSYQTTGLVSYSGAVGITVHDSNYGKWLFCSFEKYLDNPINQIELMNAQTMESNSLVTIANATNLAGIVIDNSKSKLRC